MSNISFAIRIWVGVFFNTVLMRYAFRMMVRSGELCVIQRGMKFKVRRIFLHNFQSFFNIYRFSFLMGLLADVSLFGLRLLQH